MIANENYDPPSGYHPLSTPKKDVLYLALLLNMNAGFGTKTLVDGDRDRILQEIDFFLAAGEHNDTLLLYYSGHAERYGNDAHPLYLAVKGTRKGKDDLIEKWNAVSTDDILDRMNSSYAGRIILILDCCYSGACIPKGKGLVFEGSTLPKVFDEIILDDEVEGHAIFMSSKWNEKSWSGSEINVPHGQYPSIKLFSIYTYFWIDGLLGNGTLDRKNNISLQDLHEHARKNVNRLTRNTDKEQRAFYHVTMESDITFVHGSPRVRTISEAEKLLVFNDEDFWQDIRHGEYYIGSDTTDPDAQSDELGGQSTKVRVFPFRISKFVITNEQFQAFVNAGGYDNSRYWTIPCQENLPDLMIPEPSLRHKHLPRVFVNWCEAMAFTNWLSEVLSRRIRLPTEDEWEWVARAGQQTVYPWGNEWQDDMCNSELAGHHTPTPKRHYPANDWGVFDMIGNVWEWCLTKYDRFKYLYPYDPNDGRNEIDEETRLELATSRVVRGGSFSSPPLDLRCACRKGHPINTRHNNVGFRVVEEK